MFLKSYISFLDKKIKYLLTKNVIGILYSLKIINLVSLLNKSISILFTCFYKITIEAIFHSYPNEQKGLLIDTIEYFKKIFPT